MGWLILLFVIIVIAWWYYNNQGGAAASTRVRVIAYSTRDDAMTAEYDLDVGSYDQEVVGESHYQDALHAIASHLPFKPWYVQARLELDDGNEHDPAAVAVTIGGLLVGYLPRQDARRYRAMQSARGLPMAATCAALVSGGGEGRYYSVRLGIQTLT